MFFQAVHYCQNEPLVESILNEVVQAVDVPVTLKTRLGWDDEHKKYHDHRPNGRKCRNCRVNYTRSYADADVSRKCELRFNRTSQTASQTTDLGKW